jgi:glucose/arabinose dehydrogenase
MLGRWSRPLGAVALIAGLGGLAACDPKPVAEVQLRFAPWVSGLSSPIAMAHRPGSGIPYVAERGGAVKAIVFSGPQTVLAIDGVSTAGERGLLGLAFSPDGSKLYLDYADRGGTLHLMEYNAGAGFGFDQSSGRELMSIAHSEFTNHNGGGLLVDSAGLLYWSMGDGGGGGDPHGNAQRLDTLLGKIIRIDPKPSGSAPYTIPPTNPFAKTAGARGEIYAYGLRNPFRFSLDSKTDDLWIADVGQGDIEEVDLERAPRVGGQNYGWNAFEGSKPYGPSVKTPTVFPITEYDHSAGDCSVIGGAVVRAGGGGLGALEGAYVFGDYCTGRVRAMRQASGKTSEINQNVGKVAQLVGFDTHGDSLFAISLGGTIYRTTVA